MKARTALEISRLKTRLYKKNADYTKIFLLLSNSLVSVDRHTFIERSKSIPLTKEEASFLFNYIDSGFGVAEGDGNLTYGEFIKEMAPSAIDLDLESPITEVNS